MNLNTLEEWLLFFREYRSKSEINLEKLLLRLLKTENLINIKNKKNTNRVRNNTSLRFSTNSLKELMYSINNFKRFHNNNSYKEKLIVSISFARLGKSEKNIDLRDYLKKLLKSGKLNNKYQNLIENCDLIIQDPIYISKFRQTINQDENILILDKVCIASILLQNPLKVFKLIIYTFIYLRKNYYKEILYSALIDLAYSIQSEFVLNKINLLMLTSNSFTSEVLRIHALTNKKYNIICEVQHGIPSLWEENYIKKTLALGINKMIFIPQIKNIENFGVFHYEKISINSYMNKYFSNFNYYLNDKLFIKEIGKYNIKPFDYIVTYAGTTEWIGDASPKNLNSPIYQLEKNFIKKIINILNESKLDYTFFYTYHPLVDKKLFENDLFFENERIHIIHNSVITWLISDLFATIYSSTLYEAKNFGVDVITPIRKSDMIYPDIYLSNINHPDECELYSDVLNRILSNKTEREPIIQKALKRFYEIY
jgi:hypothetical protein